MKNKMIFTAIALPFLILCLLIARAEYHVRNGELWAFELQGYDPRDLLRGHYLQFNILYDWDKEKNECSSGIDCCLCLTKSSSLVKNSVVPKVHKSSCTSAKRCDGYILPSKQNVLNRYYIPEESAKRAESLLIKAHAKKQAYLQVSINKKGEPAIVDLILDNQSINERLKVDDSSD